MRIKSVADTLGIGTNDLMNLLVWRGLGQAIAEEWLLFLRYDLHERRRPRPKAKPVLTRLVTLNISPTLNRVIRDHFKEGQWNKALCAMMEQSLGFFESEAKFCRDWLASGQYYDEFEKWHESHPEGTPSTFDAEIRKKNLSDAK